MLFPDTLNTVILIYLSADSFRNLVKKLPADDIV